MHAAPGSTRGGCLGQSPSVQAQDISLPEQWVPNQGLSLCLSPLHTSCTGGFQLSKKQREQVDGCAPHRILLQGGTHIRQPQATALGISVLSIALQQREQAGEEPGVPPSCQCSSFPASTTALSAAKLLDCLTKETTASASTALFQGSAPKNGVWKLTS